jgi:putative membrane protein
MSIWLSWLVLSLAIYLTALVLPGFQVRGFFGAIVVAAIFGLLNWLLGWLIFAFLSVATLGVGYLLAFITRWFVTAILLKLTDVFSDNLTIRGFAPALIGALLMSAFGTAGEYLVRHLTQHPHTLNFL